MAKTAIADIIIPTEFEKYAIERTAELSTFGQCGIVEHAPEFDALAAGGGREVKMPFWKDLTATRQLLSDAASLTVNKITSDQDIARIHNDAQVWSVNHLAKVISGDDPMGAIVDLVAAYWARIDEGLVVSCLKGMFAAATIGAAQKDTAREIGAKLASLKGVVWVGLGLFLFGLASLVYPPLRAIIGSVTTSVGMAAGGVALMVLPTMIVGNELLILGGVALAVGAWFLAHRHGQLKGMVDANQNGIDDRIEAALAKLKNGGEEKT
jgi:hypothetical protein